VPALMSALGTKRTDSLRCCDVCKVPEADVGFAPIPGSKAPIIKNWISAITQGAPVIDRERISAIASSA
jgi:hypothetical protein